MSLSFCLTPHCPPCTACILFLPFFRSLSSFPPLFPLPSTLDRSPQPLLLPPIPSHPSSFPSTTLPPITSYPIPQTSATDKNDGTERHNDQALTTGEQSWSWATTHTFSAILTVISLSMQQSLILCPHIRALATCYHTSTYPPSLYLTLHSPFPHPSSLLFSPSFTPFLTLSPHPPITYPPLPHASQIITRYQPPQSNLGRRTPSCQTITISCR